MNKTASGDLVGYIPDLMKKLTEKTKKEFELTLVADGKYGSKNDGKWNGMIAEVVEGVSEMGRGAKH